MSQVIIINVYNDCLFLGLVELPPGKIFRKRYRVIGRIGEGGCGVVFLVEDIVNRTKAALKAESRFVIGGSVLKLEVQVLKRLQGRKFVPQLISSGKKQNYSYMVS
jgi:predicted Ser/Thr protein kinase